MALERRGHSEYYYRTQRRGKKVTRTYVASGEDALLAAAVADHGRLGKRLQREAIEAEQAVWDAACQPLDAFAELTDLLLTATLLAANYHQHHRGEWRRRRGKQ